jgi:hypothetical protein
MYSPPTPPGTTLDPKSDYARYWPGQPALFKFRDNLILAIPPMYQQFWIQRDRVVRSPAPKEKIPQVKLIGFQFFMPDFGGYTPQNYLNEFDEDRVDVVSMEPVQPRTDGRPPSYSDIEGAIERLSGFALIPDKFEERYGLRCFDSPRMDEPPRTCLGQRAEGERMLLSISVPPYPAWLSFPLMQTTYYTKAYGGMQVTWRSHMKHFSRWLDIDRQIWKFVDEWNIAK